jgi:predicted NBD/HSP70 family sugar kinase
MRPIGPTSSEALTKPQRTLEYLRQVEEIDRGGSLGSLRSLNRERVVAALRELGVASRADIARRTGLSRSTVSSLVAALQDEGLIVDRDASPEGTASTGGRPPALIALGRRAGVALGIDFGKRHLAVAAADLSHTVLAEVRHEMPDDYDARRGLDEAAALVEQVLDEAAVGSDEVLGVGLGVPGPIHLPTGVVGSSAILPGWVGARVAAEMRDRLDMPVHVDNDANLGALAELHWGAGQGCSSLTYIKIATGIGAGLVLERRLFRGAGGTAGEIGHTTIDESGPICRCGSRGCLETFASLPAILDLLRPSLGDELTAEDVITRAGEGDLACRRAIGDAGGHIGAALANACNLINPRRIVVGGSLAQAGEVLLEPLREAVQRRAIPSAAADVEVVAGELGGRAEMLGALALVLYESEGAATVQADPGNPTSRQQLPGRRS